MFLLQSSSPTAKQEEVLCQSPPRKRHADDITSPLSLDDIFLHPPSPDPSSPSTSMEAVIEQLFRDGVAHEEQWTFPSRELVHEDVRKKILDVLQEKFAPSIPLIHQLPAEDGDALRSAFRDVTDNWFFQLFESEGYDGTAVSATIYNWLNGDINTLVLCGGKLSNAKLLYNAVVACFPLAVTDMNINSIPSLASIAPRASLYCVPFVEEKPNSLLLHYLEGNPLTCCIDSKVTHVKRVPCLIHCSDVTLASHFIARNTTVFFMVGDHAKSPLCYTPRQELRDFIHSSSPPPPRCAMTLHCRKEHPLCNPCIRASVANVVASACN
ncbi:hypothetical protein D1U31_gp12 [Psittacine aviadenovirus B]|uniref:Parvovirus non-structural protein 1 helicase domain-containing protein n=1 Tax=psittacine adenovirus 4 TaxID=2773287 RepID=A0A1P8SW63_9ADEN|nr:hypothetical protein D1U31_gp12 [Psittacine aviadenovirus B]APY28343.1 hypothetical protein [psittacine adenovirus 4]